MKTLETINGTFVRHNWKAVTEGLAEGKTFLVENHGKLEAVVSAPDNLDDPKPGTFDLDAHLSRLLKRPAIKMSAVNRALARSPE